MIGEFIVGFWPGYALPDPIGDATLLWPGFAGAGERAGSVISCIRS